MACKEKSGSSRALSNRSRGCRAQRSSSIGCSAKNACDADSKDASRKDSGVRRDRAGSSHPVIDSRVSSRPGHSQVLLPRTEQERNFQRLFGVQVGAKKTIERKRVHASLARATPQSATAPSNRHCDDVAEISRHANGKTFPSFELDSDMIQEIRATWLMFCLKTGSSENADAAILEHLRPSSPEFAELFHAGVETLRNRGRSPNNVTHTAQDLHDKLKATERRSVALIDAALARSKQAQHDNATSSGDVDASADFSTLNPFTAILADILRQTGEGHSEATEGVQDLLKMLSPLRKGRISKDTLPRNRTGIETASGVSCATVVREGGDSDAACPAQACVGNAGAPPVRAPACQPGLRAADAPADAAGADASLQNELAPPDEAPFPMAHLDGRVTSVNCLSKPRIVSL